MKAKTIATIIALFVMMVCFFLAGLFFASAGMVDEETGDLDEWRTVQILNDLDKIPFVHIDEDEIVFTSYGSVIDITNTTITIKTREGFETYEHNSNISKEYLGKKSIISYKYLENAEIKFVKIIEIRNNIPEQ